ncbi:GNAT family N-acetyltransferase [uncultured Desulfosarcina sp.]|uniref:GNAT family N-acetyltransferase n=1 Tax=uncultured Desulfosarcina sp. TaxID=218289 RepID=UPI0029C72839|nr:GNAT family N-acetyltransferase [uncultured Desulfosarcina sp.]
MENVRIRELQVADTDDICEIYASIVRKPVDVDFTALIEKHARTENDICFVAELDGKVIGFMISYILTFGFGIEKSAWIATLGVDPEFMGQGIGDRLAREIFKLYKQMGINRVYTSVRWDSTDLLSFFKTLGFDRSKFINLKKDL